MPFELPLVDIVIPVFGQFEKAGQCIEAVLAQEGGFPIQIYVVDDASPDQDAADKFYEQYRNDKKIKIFRNKTNHGFGATVQHGARKGAAPLILFLNSDVLLQPDSLYNMVREFDDPEVGVVGPLLTFSDDSPNGPIGKVQHAGMVIDITGKPYHLHLGWDPENPRVQTRKEMQVVTGACMLTRRKVFMAIGFNPIYGRGTYEDMEYCLRVRSGGLKVVFTPKARGTHYTGASVIGAQIAYPLRENFQKFLNACRGMFVWDEYVHW